MNEDIVELDPLDFEGEQRIIQSVDVYINKRKIGTLKHFDNPSEEIKLEGSGIYEFSYYRPEDLLASEGDYQLSVTGRFPVRKEPYFFTDQTAFERADRTYSLNQSERLGLKDKKGQITLKSDVKKKKVIATALPSILFNGIPQGALLKIIMDSPDYVDVDFGANILGLLSITGANPIGRLRFCETGSDLPDHKREVKDASTIIKFLDSGEKNSDPLSIIQLLAHYYHKESGVSGAMPKFIANIATKALTDVEVQQHLMRSKYSFDRDLSVELPEGLSEDSNVSGAGIGAIFKTGRKDVPGGVINEFICMSGLGASGGTIADINITAKANALVSKRFEMIQDEKGMDAGLNLGFEELTSIMDRSVTDKGKGFDVPYKEKGTRSTVTLLDIYHAVKEVVSFSNRDTATDELFRSFVFSNIVRNGDAHLRNFGILYNEDMSEVWLAPSYDITCTDIYSSISAYNFMGVTEPLFDEAKQDVGWMTMRDVNKLASAMGFSQKRKKAIIGDIIKGLESVVLSLDKPTANNANYQSETLNILTMHCMFGSFEESIKEFYEKPDYALPDTPAIDAEYDAYLTELSTMDNNELIDAYGLSVRYLKAKYIPEIVDLYISRNVMPGVTEECWGIPANVTSKQVDDNAVTQQIHQQQDQFDALLAQIHGSIDTEITAAPEDIASFIESAGDLDDDTDGFRKTVIDDYLNSDTSTDLEGDLPPSLRLR